MKKSLLSAALFAAPIVTHAAGFALIEQSASGTGNAYAGAAAVAEDASTIFFNPAGMTYIQGTQAAGALHVIRLSADFNDNSSTKGFSAPAALVPRGGNGGDLGGFGFVPNIYYKTDITDTVKFGFAINAPFRLKTDYNNDWVGRFQADKSELKTVNINPSIAFKLNDQLSLGFGVSAMWIQAELTRALNRVTAAESDVKIKGDDWGFGANIGAIYQATPDTRFGLAYRSKVTQKLEGDAKFAGVASVNNTNVKAGVNLPETASFSAFSSLNSKWDLLGDVTWTRWSRFKELRIDFSNALPDAVTPENWNNTLRYSIGLNYHYDEKLKLRAGIAYDEGPIDTQYRTARIPDNDRKWLSLGAGWQATENTKLDIGYAHLFVKDAKIDDVQNNAAEGFNGNINGKYQGSADVLSVQVTHNF
ncbi:long-chain fatty acid transport protein [Methylophilaceae bacterium 11]|nr:long-chain fatty acid transport protein [Methylophilaceae bacterium 11]